MMITRATARELRARLAEAGSPERAAAICESERCAIRPYTSRPLEVAQMALRKLANANPTIQAKVIAQIEAIADRPAPAEAQS